jgi:hypothetical protein
MTTLRTAGGENGAATTGTRTDEEAVGALAADHGRLVGALHDRKSCKSEKRSKITLVSIVVKHLRFIRPWQAVDKSVSNK